MSTFEVFKNEFQGDIVVPTDQDYAAAIARWAPTAERKAKVVAFVKDSQDVARAIKYAKANHLPIAIRGGGHNPSGACSSEDGLVIDLSRYINGITVDPDNRLAHVGGGAMWNEVDKATMNHGLAAVAATACNIGVGGFTLGGGFGWLTPAYGLAIDNIVQATVVTANGDILVASESENSDLFFGIRGGGCNFGVVTAFTFRVYPQRPTVYGGLLLFPLSAIESVVDVTNKWYAQASEKESMMHEFSLMPDGTPVAKLVLFYNGSEAEGRKAYKPFFDIGPIADHTFDIPYAAFNSAVQPSGKGTYMTSVRQAIYSAEIVKKCLDIIVETSKDTKIDTAFYCYLCKVNTVNETAYRRVKSDALFIMLQWDGDSSSVLSPSFDSEEREKTMEEARVIAHKLASTIVSGQPETGEPFHLGYGNLDCDTVVDKLFGTKDKPSQNFGENYPRLQAIKKRYDPENIFNKWFPVTPCD